MLLMSFHLVSISRLYFSKGPNGKQLAVRGLLLVPETLPAWPGALQLQFDQTQGIMSNCFPDGLKKENSSFKFLSRKRSEMANCARKATLGNSGSPSCYFDS
jgi:hypothetical protein